ncbi:MAG: hypothetical protein HY053_01510, partial [Proteobacteria bacterium]|nr:hypothetical protein [Pseudomonadota bacterium]
SPASALAQEKRISVQGQLTCADTPRLTISARPDGSDSGAVLGGTLVAIAGGPKADDSRLSTFTLGSHELPAHTQTKWTGETSHTFRHAHLLLKPDFAVTQDKPYTDMDLP